MMGNCHICGAYGYVERHHIFGGTSNRKNSEADGLVVYLCPDCHRNGVHAAHRCRETDLRLKEDGERKWLEDNDNDVTAFIRRYGKNFL